MDDFLHNLRSGKLKQPDRSNRSYNDQQYKGGQRRPMVDRRKRDYENKESSERLNALKEVLENLAESQKRIINAMETRNQVEDRKANALEILAKKVLGLLNPETVGTDLFGKITPSAETDPKNEESTPSESSPKADAVENNTPEIVEAKAEKTSAPKRAKQADGAASEKSADNQIKIAGKLTIIDQQTLYPIISRMREKGESWERIARHIADKGYPTVSGKGQWRGVMVKNLFERLTT